MISSDAAIDLAFDALDEAARIVRGNATDKDATSKKKNGAYWHAILFPAISKSVTKLQSTKLRIEKWIANDLAAAVPALLGRVGEGSSAATATTDSGAATDRISAAVTDVAAVQRICESFVAYKKISFAATVIFEAVESSKTNKLDIQKAMMIGYRDQVFGKVRDVLFDYIMDRIALCRLKEDVMPSGGGVLRTSCRMFATIAALFDSAQDSSEYYDRHFCRKYTDVALTHARAHVDAFLRASGASLDGLLTWADERIAFEKQLVELFVLQEGAATRFSLETFERQLRLAIVVPHLETVVHHPLYGFVANNPLCAWDLLGLEGNNKQLDNHH